MNRTPILFLNVLVIAACGLVYELLAGTVASYVIGDSVTQFSLIIGLYLSALGVGAWLSRYLEGDLAARFVEIEIGVALIGGLSAPLLFFGFARLQWFQLFLFLVVFVIGVLVGLELPILMRILKEHLDFKDLVSRVLSFDYLGSLFAAVLFPLFLVPRIGLVRTSIVFGFLNGCVGLYGTYLLAPLIPRRLTALRVRAAVVMVILVIAFVQAKTLTSLAEEELFADEIVYATSSPYQRIVVTRGASGFHLFLNGNLQFSSADEYRYHEALVHPAMSLAGAPRRVLICGGGDGLALREVLRYPDVEAVTLVELDPAMIRLARHDPRISALNRHSFDDPRVRVVNEDAFAWLRTNQDRYDAAVVDMPDPDETATAKLYSVEFYALVGHALDPAGRMVVQAGSPWFAPQEYWCVEKSISTAGYATVPYHVDVPSFGDWGVVLAAPGSVPPPLRVDAPAPPRFLNGPTLTAAANFPPDRGKVDVPPSTLLEPRILAYARKEWVGY